MKQEEGTRVVIVCGLRAGRTVEEIMSYGNIKKSTVYDVKKKFDEFIASGGSADQFLTAMKVHKDAAATRGPPWLPTWRSSSPGTPAGP